MGPDVLLSGPRLKTESIGDVDLGTPLEFGWVLLGGLSYYGVAEAEVLGVVMGFGVLEELGIAVEGVTGNDGEVVTAFDL